MYGCTLVAILKNAAFQECVQNILFKNPTPSMSNVNNYIFVYGRYIVYAIYACTGGVLQTNFYVFGVTAVIHWF